MNMIMVIGGANAIALCVILAMDPAFSLRDTQADTLVIAVWTNLPRRIGESLCKRTYQIFERNE